MTKRELKQQQKPWITTGILNSMKRRDRLLKKFTKAKHELIKIQYHKEYKKLKNQIVALCRINKKIYYQNFFTENANNLKKTWQGIKSIININSNNKSQPNLTLQLLLMNSIIIFPMLLAICRITQFWTSFFKTS